MEAQIPIQSALEVASVSNTGVRYGGQVMRWWRFFCIGIIGNTVGNVYCVRIDRAFLCVQLSRVHEYLVHLRDQLGFTLVERHIDVGERILIVDMIATSIVSHG